MSYYKSRNEDEEISIYSGNYLRLFSPLQVMIDQAIIKSKTSKDISLQSSIGKMSKPSVENIFVEDQSKKDELNIKATLYFTIFIVQFINIMKCILNEKQNKQEDGLITIGIHPSAIWLSWELLYLPLILIIALFTTVCEINCLFKSINILLSISLVFSYGISISGLSVFLTKLFKDANQAIFISCIGMLMLIFEMGNIYSFCLSHPVLDKIICLLVSPISFTMALAEIQKAHFNPNPLSFSEIFGKGFGVYLVLILCNILIIHGVILLLETFKFRILNGIRRKGDFTINNIFNDDIEEDLNENRKPLVEVHDLFKIYKEKGIFKRKKFNVLDGISFNVYENEIFGILGHNGAGKSTLIKVMTGLILINVSLIPLTCTTIVKSIMIFKILILYPHLQKQPLNPI